MTGRDEQGVATAWGLGLIGLLAVMAFVAAAVIGILAGHRRAEAAADLAALAGAGELRDGGDACGTAGLIARRNRAALVDCRPVGWRVEVVVRVRVRGLFGRVHALEGRALAGPAQETGPATGLAGDGPGP